METQAETSIKTQKSTKKEVILKDISDFLQCIFGGIICSVGLNLLILPFGLYIGNLTGIAKIILELLQNVMPSLQDATGLILLALNLPLLIIAFSSINRKFFFKTLVTVITVSLVMIFVPVMVIIPGLYDLLTLAVLGGIICGFGVGLSLRAGGSSGGVNILDVLISLRKPDFGVGRVSLFISMIVYSYALFTSPPVIVIYSVIFT